MNIKEVTYLDIFQKITEKKHLLEFKKIFGVPKNGTILAFMIAQYNVPCEVVMNVIEADVIVDDLIDSGQTKESYAKHGIEFVALFEKREGVWLKFPWETESDIESAVIRQIEFIGENVKREGLRDTPARVIRSWSKLYGGYHDNPAEILHTTFNEKYDEVVLVRDIELYSTCEHHLLPFFGKCHIAYIPDKKIVGVSKLVRLMECFARRMQIQERLVNLIADSIQEHLTPKAVGVVIEAQHFCMTARGVEKQKSIMVTSALRGQFLTDVNARQEFLTLIRSK